MTGPKVDLTVAELARLTAEVQRPEGPGEATVTKQFNANMLTALRAGQGHIEGELSGILLLIMTHRGRKSGRHRSAPLGYFPIEGRVVVIASMGGSDLNPEWYYNILAQPTVRVELNGVDFNATATPTIGGDRDALFAEICRRSPVFNEYQSRTTRVIPVVEFTTDEVDLIQVVGFDAIPHS